MPPLLAGSAIAQGPNVGKIAKLSEWNQSSNRTKWLLLAGASDPPSEIAISDRRTRDTPGQKGGTFLPGVSHDFVNMEDAVGNNLFNTVRMFNLKKSVALDSIRELFNECSKAKIKPILYYTGHGEIGTGNWCFSDGTISIEEILHMLPPTSSHHPLISDTCYSGHWANSCLRKNIKGFHCLAACPEYSKALDTRGKGGDLTLFITGNIPRPRTEPLYSLKNRNDFPITAGYNGGEYTEFIDSHVSSSEDVLISQSFHNGHLSCIFGSSKDYRPRPAVSCVILKNYDSFIKLVQKEKQTGKKSKHIYSLECDENLGFAAFFMEEYGKAQEILTNTSDVEKKMKEGFKITACTAQDSVFYIIMTKGAKGYRKKQEWFTLGSWDEAKRLIQEKQKERRVVTGICYSTGQNKYLIVVMEIAHDQIFRKFNRGADLKKWVEKEHDEEGFHPTIIFRDPNDEQTLVVMIKDGSKPPYSLTYDFKVVS